MPGAPHPHLGDPHRDARRRLTAGSSRRIILHQRNRHAGRRTHRSQDGFSADEWSRLTSRSSLRGMWLVAHAWGTIAAAVALVTLWPNPLTWLIAVMVVGSAPARACDPDARSRAWRTARQQGDQRMGRAMAVRGAGRRRSRQLPVLSSAASQVHPAAGRSRSVAVGAVSDHQGKLPPQGDPRPHRPDVCEAAAAAVPVAVQARARATTRLSHESFVSSGADKMARFLCVNAVLFGLFWLAGAGIWYLGVWVFAMATWLPLVTRDPQHRRTRLHSAPEPIRSARRAPRSPTRSSACSSRPIG